MPDNSPPETNGSDLSKPILMWHTMTLETSAAATDSGLGVLIPVHLLLHHPNKQQYTKTEQTRPKTPHKSEDPWSCPPLGVETERMEARKTDKISRREMRAVCSIDAEACNVILLFKKKN